MYYVMIPGYLRVLFAKNGFDMSQSRIINFYVIALSFTHYFYVELLCIILKNFSSKGRKEGPDLCVLLGRIFSSAQNNEFTRSTDVKRCERPLDKDM